MTPLPIIVDLDNSLLLTDTLHEQLMQMVFHSPGLLPAGAHALLQGKAAFKAFLARKVPLDPTTLPYREELLQYLKNQKAAGTKIALCTAANSAVALVIGQHLGFFDEIFSSDENVNLRGAAKAEYLRNRFPDGFVYAADGFVDLPVWRESSGIILVGASSMTANRARMLGKPIVMNFDRSRSREPLVRDWARALRVHHWSKNLLMLVPLILAHSWFDISAFVKTFQGLALLLAVTSSTYLINDLADLDADRRHWTKRLRPIASGTIPIWQAAVAAVIAMLSTVVLAWLLSYGFGFALSAYLFITLSYSFGLKRIALLDTFLIAVLFTMRLLMGMALAGSGYSEWLVTFSLFFFFSLAMAKRQAEILRAVHFGSQSLKSRGYEVDDAPLTLVFGVASGLCSLVILVLYLVEEAFQRVPYDRPQFLWVIPLVLSVWIGRIWLLAHRGWMNDDPVSFAIRDKVSWGLGVLITIAFVLAL